MLRRSAGRLEQCNLGCICLAVAVVVLLLTNVTSAAALAGQQTCPTKFDTASMAAWCKARFGGYGGTLFATAWDRRRQSFSCVCNGNPSASLRITRLTSSPQLAYVGHELGYATRAEATSSLSYHSESTDSVAPLPISSSVEEDSSSSISSSSSSNDYVNGSCTWSGTFTEYPDGVQCMATTGVCPSSCSVIPPNLCNNAYTNSETCSSNGATQVSYTCMTCNGRNYTITSTVASNGAVNCSRYYSSADTCNAKSACSGHGCCVGPSADTGSTSTTCTRFSDGLNGYYTGSSCNSCQNGYSENSAQLCVVVTNRVQFILASIAKTWTMVAPNMAVLFLFVIFGVTRKLNASDRPFDLTGLRRANLSTVQVARRRQQSLFHSKYIPMRPAKSRSFANPHQPQARGPPAF